VARLQFVARLQLAAQLHNMAARPQARVAQALCAARLPLVAWPRRRVL